MKLALRARHYEKALQLGVGVRRMHRSLYSDMSRSFIVVLVATLVGCQGKTTRTTAGQPGAQQRSGATGAARADSAQAFVQRFYDWYLATEDQKGSPYDSLLTTRRSLLGDSLREALGADIAAQRADTVGEIASLSAEADIFLNSQDPCPRYTAQTPRTIGSARVVVRVAGNCNGLDARPNIEVELRPAGTGWQIDNIKDPTDPAFDLTNALRRYHAPEVVPGGADSVSGR